MPQNTRMGQVVAGGLYPAGTLVLSVYLLRGSRGLHEGPNPEQSVTSEYEYASTLRAYS